MFVRARVRARANKHTADLFTKRPRFVTRCFNSVITELKQLPPHHRPPDTLLILLAVTNVTPPLRGGVTFARLAGIVAQQNKFKSYQI